MRPEKRMSVPIWVDYANASNEINPGYEFNVVVHFGSAADITLTQVGGTETVWRNVAPDREIAGRFTAIKANAGLTNIKIGRMT